MLGHETVSCAVRNSSSIGPKKYSAPVDLSVIGIPNGFGTNPMKLIAQRQLRCYGKFPSHARIIMFRFLLVIQSNLCTAFQSVVVNCPLIGALKELLLHFSIFVSLVSMTPNLFMSSNFPRSGAHH